MEITPRNLAAFERWMTEERGRGEDTVRIYKGHLRLAAADAKGVTNRLVSNDLAPKTRRTIMAAMAAWATFAEDAPLTKRLKGIRLPPARRVGVKIPLSEPDWPKYIQHLQSCAVRSDVLRHVVLIIAKRGLRCSDALRIRRREVLAAIETGTLAFEGKGRKRTEYSAKPVLDELRGLAALPGKWDRLSELVSRGPKNHRRAAANRIARLMKKAGKDAGIVDVHPHRLRRTYATRFLEQLAGDPRAIIKLQKHMDWESITTAAMYADAVDAEELDQVGDRLVAGLSKR